MRPEPLSSVLWPVGSNDNHPQITKTGTEGLHSLEYFLSGPLGKCVRTPGLEPQMSVTALPPPRPTGEGHNHLTAVQPILEPVFKYRREIAVA